jgi:crotonobetainyl-CoA:carnitine CoA-transferase CaiB-like acyl-CoA transferase
METKTLDPRSTGPLSGIRILDLTSVVNGAYGTQILADQGADVIKIEDPGSRRGDGGDIMRWTGHPPEGAPGMGPIFLAINRNKRSIVLNMKSESGKRALHRLIRSCDVLASSVRYEGMKRLGLSYEDVAAIKSDIIFVHAAGYGSDGPYAGEPAYDDLIQSASGMADILPRTDGDPTPRILPTLVADKIAGLFLSQAVTAALLHKARTGAGQFVEVPMFECVTSFLLVEHLFDNTFQPPTGQWGYDRVLNPNRKPHRTKDGYIGLLPYTDKQWDQFFQAAGYGDLIQSDPRFADYASRAKHVEELYGMIEKAAATKTTQEWLDILKPKPPVRFMKTPSNIRRHPPKLGEHTDEVMAEVDAMNAAD